MNLASRPNIFDNLAVKIYPRYLYPGQLCESLAEINVGILHKLPDIKTNWKILDYFYLKKGSLMKFLGLARTLKIVGDIEPQFSIMEMILPLADESKSFDRQLSKGDLVCLTPYDRQFIIASK
jgi:hypothetical protein